MIPKNYPQLTFRFGPDTSTMLDFLSLTRGRSKGAIAREAIKIYCQAMSATTIESPAAEYEHYDYRVHNPITDTKLIADENTKIMT